MTEVETRLVAEDETGLRLDRWFKRHFPDLTHGRLERLLRTGQVRVDGKRAKAGCRLEPGQAVRVPPLGEAPPSAVSTRPVDLEPRAVAELRARILFRDDDVLVLDKPAGLAVQGGTATPRHLDGLLDALRFEAPDRPRLVHRLDKDTSGVLVLARSVWAAGQLAEAFRGRDAHKTYWAVTVAVPQPHEGKIDVPLAKQASARGERVATDDEEGRRAVTYYRVVEAAGRKAAFVALWPATGRTHQLRVHMAAIGTPILGDGKYGGADAFLAGAEVASRLHLHARRLVIPHPRRGEIDVTAPLPPHMAETWAWFGFDTAPRGLPVSPESGT
ncbi:MAG: RluA family pseudouridine synthase [Azospirillum sp.]|nr:RluA family pseudouridine synthase [Azospirillum sp.]